MKLNELINDLTKKHVLGKTNGYMYTVEFQKRGLPHAHILLFLDAEDQVWSPDHYDALISAELPDPNLEPELFNLVSKNMMHGPCGPAFPSAPCCNDQPEHKCSKGFPKQFCEKTKDNDDGYPLYRRRDNGRHIVTSDGALLDNRWVVPHNKALLLKYQCHINVEVCASIRSIKYLHKYVYKGPDRALLAIGGNVAEVVGDDRPREVDEIQQFLDGRYVSAIEACWRMFEFPMHGESPNVLRLALHLPNQQTITFRDGEAIEEVVRRPPKTILIAWMEKNSEIKASLMSLCDDSPEACCVYCWFIVGLF